MRRVQGLSLRWCEGKINLDNHHKELSSPCEPFCVVRPSCVVRCRCNNVYIHLVSILLEATSVTRKSPRWQKSYIPYTRRRMFTIRWWQTRGCNPFTAFNSIFKRLQKMSLTQFFRREKVDTIPLLPMGQVLRLSHAPFLPPTVTRVLRNIGV